MDLTTPLLLRMTFTSIVLAVLFVPIWVYLTNGWWARHREITAAFPGKVVRKYFETFFPNEVERTKKRVGKARWFTVEFGNHYVERFGIHRFFVPGSLLAITASVLGYSVTHSVLAYLGPPGMAAGILLPSVAIFAIAGAYMWIVYEIIGRIQRNDLSPTDLLWASFRLMIAVPLGYAFAELFRDTGGFAVAFCLGGFPTRHLVALVRKVHLTRIRVQDGCEELGRELERLQGIGRWQSERFSEEGVATVLQLAYADPIDLTIRTGFAFSYVVDCCSQALAWVSFEDDMEILRRFGLRGAQEVHTFVLQIDKATDESRKVMKTNRRLAIATLEALARRLKVSQPALFTDPVLAA